MDRVCVFCGSSPGARPVYVETARAVGETLARRGLGLVYGGGRVGLMGAVADSCLRAGGEVIGVIPEHLERKEVGNTDVTDLRVVGSMHERKALMADLSDGFLALPGGCGTFEEFFETLTWAQLGLHRKPCAILNVDGYYDGLLALLENAIVERFMKPEDRRLVLDSADLESLLDAMEHHTPPVVEKWLDREMT